MNVLLPVSVAFCLLLAFLALGKKKKDTADVLLVVWLLLTAIEITVFGTHTTDSWQRYPHVIGIRQLFPFIHAPLLYIYIRYRRTKTPDR